MTHVVGHNVAPGFTADDLFAGPGSAFDQVDAVNLQGANAEELLASEADIRFERLPGTIINLARDTGLSVRQIINAYETDNFDLINRILENQVYQLHRRRNAIGHPGQTNVPGGDPRYRDQNAIDQYLIFRRPLPRVAT